MEIKGSLSNGAGAGYALFTFTNLAVENTEKKIVQLFQSLDGCSMEQLQRCGISDPRLCSRCCLVPRSFAPSVFMMFKERNEKDGASAKSIRSGLP